MDESTPPALELTGVSKNFGSFAAVHDLTLRVQPGEIFALLGPNGAGKTTLISCIAGLDDPTTGSIRVFGHDTRSAFRATRRLVGLVPQEIAFDPFFTPHESLMIQMGLMGIRPDAKRADALLEKLSLLDKRDAYTRRLSGGMKRRLLVAKALVHSPRLLFLDEPTAGVDVELRRDLWTEVERLRAEGTTIILTTHYLEEAEALADRVGVIHHGELLLVENKASLMQRFRRCSVTLRSDALPELLPDALRAREAERVDDHTIRVPWQTPADLEAILVAARETIVIRDVSIAQTTLEEVFVNLIDQANEGRAQGGL